MIPESMNGRTPGKTVLLSERAGYKYPQQINNSFKGSKHTFYNNISPSIEALATMIKTRKIDIRISDKRGSV